MDLFYKPPLQRRDECEALEDNYMNCLLQKAMRDRVNASRCNMDSILWFHLECPKAAAKFDDPNEFKVKFRDMFANLRANYEAVNDTSEEEKRIDKMYNYLPYPEDVKEVVDIRKFTDEFDKYSPILVPEPEDEEDIEYNMSEVDEPIP